MTTWRVLLHALDRTGPPMLARALLRWARDNRPDVVPDIVALRGGPLMTDFLELGRTVVALDPEQPWDHPHPRAVARTRERLSGTGPADVTLAVSVSVAPLLPVLPDTGGPLATWVVELEEDYRPELVARTTSWMAGSDIVARDVGDRLGRDVPVAHAPEFVEEVPPLATVARDRYRAAMGAGPGDLLVVGAGIATRRKGLDLFLEAALAARRSGPAGLRFVWLGGGREPLFHAVLAEIDRTGPDTLRLLGEVPAVEPFLGAADIFLHTARVDAFPLVCLHAAAGGTPVVAFDGTGGVTGMLGDSFTGAPYPDTAGLVEALARLSDTQQRAAVAADQRAAVRSRYVADVAAPLVAARLDALASEAR